MGQNDDPIRGEDEDLSQTQDADQASAWRSPVLESSGKPVRVTFWAADNYVNQPDYSYSAAVGLAALGPDGAPAAPPSWEQIPWDDGRKEQWWGPLAPDALVWKYYAFTAAPPTGRFCVSFFWPKALSRGDCYLADLWYYPNGPEPDAEPLVLVDLLPQKRGASKRIIELPYDWVVALGNHAYAVHRGRGGRGTR